MTQRSIKVTIGLVAQENKDMKYAVKLFNCDIYLKSDLKRCSDIQEANIFQKVGQDSRNGSINATADEKLRAIAYSMDVLLPGIYIWFGAFNIRFGGTTPDDEPYRYPGTIHSPVGMALVLPGYRIFSTYQGTYDPGQAQD